VLRWGIEADTKYTNKYANVRLCLFFTDYKEENLTRQCDRKWMDVGGWWKAML
jgi:hypothetical protein